MSTGKIKPKKQSPRSQENTAEFGRAAKASRLIRTAFYQLVKDTAEHAQAGRLIAKMNQIIKTDNVHRRGQRMPAAGDLSLLEGFDFSSKKQVYRLLHTSFEATIIRKTGQCGVYIPEFTPVCNMDIEGNISHVVLIAAATVLDFERETFVTDIVRSVPCDIRQPVTLSLQPRITPGSTHPILLTLGIQFHQQVNGHFYPMCMGGKTALAVVKTDTVPPASKTGKQK